MQVLANDLNNQFPENTVVQFKELPTLHALLALNRNELLQAIEALRPATPYESGIMAMGAGLYPVYVRGEAYLAAREGGQAAGEFQKITDRRSIGWNPVGALAPIDPPPEKFLWKSMWTTNWSPVEHPSRELRGCLLGKSDTVVPQAD